MKPVALTTAGPLLIASVLCQSGCVSMLPESAGQAEVDFRAFQRQARFPRSWDQLPPKVRDSAMVQDLPEETVIHWVEYDNPYWISNHYSFETPSGGVVDVDPDGNRIQASRVHGGIL